MSENMSAEDVLDVLGGYGSVSLQKGKFTSAGSPHLRGQPELWKLEITLPGYHGEHGPVRLKSEGASIRDAVQAAYAALESYVFSERQISDRKRYEDERDFYQRRYDQASAHQLTGFDPVRPPAPLVPPIVWGEARGGIIQ